MGFKFRFINLVKVVLLIHFALAEPYLYEDDSDADTEIQNNSIESNTRNLKNNNTQQQDCWLKLNAADYVRAMDELDSEYKEARQNYQRNVGPKMNREMLDELLNSRGAAHRAIHRAGGDANRIPAGLNLGGFCMTRLQDSILFFHRLKLRNSTHFQVNYLHNDLVNMALVTRIGLNDLHLVGAYERTAVDKDPSILFYRPSYGTIELLMKNVMYKMEARLRMLSDRITIEVMTSELIFPDEILMTYLNTNITEEPEYTVQLETRNLDDFLQRLKTDLDLWLKDYFNDYLMYYQLPEYDNTKIQDHEKKKMLLQNEYISYAINMINHKIYTLGGNSLKMPSFTFFSVPNMMLKIKDGVLRGLDSMYRRSVGTGVKHNDVRTIDVIVGFSKLRATYRFEAVLPNGSPPLSGNLVLTADELTAHLAISLVTEPESIDINFDFIQQMSPESLSVEGPTNRLLSNYKHLLENQILAIMSNALLHNVKMLNTITRCVPFLYGAKDVDEILNLESTTESDGYYLRNSKLSPKKRHAKKVSLVSTKQENIRRMFEQFKKKYV